MEKLTNQSTLFSDSTGRIPFDSLEHHSDLAVMAFGNDDRKRVNFHLRKNKLIYSGWTDDGRYMVLIFPKIERKSESVFISTEFEANWIEFNKGINSVGIAHAIAIFKREQTWNVRGQPNRKGHR